MVYDTTRSGEYAPKVFSRTGLPMRSGTEQILRVCHRLPEVKWTEAELAE